MSKIFAPGEPSPYFSADDSPITADGAEHPSIDLKIFPCRLLLYQSLLSTLKLPHSQSKQGKHSARKPPKLNILRISDGAHSEANNEMQYNAKLCDTMQYNALQ